MTRKPSKHKEHGLKRVSYFFMLFGVAFIHILSFIPERNINILYRLVDKAYRTIGGKMA